MKFNDMIFWYDRSRWFSFEDRISRAVRYYQQKFGRSPTMILVHESEGIEETELLGIPVRPSSKGVLECHFTLGIEVV